MLKNSIDWRFFIPMPTTSGRVLIIDVDYDEYFYLYKNLSGYVIDYYSNLHDFFSEKRLPSYNIVIIPHGVSVEDWDNRLLQKIKHVLLPGGVLFLGFYNSFGFPALIKNKNNAATINKVRSFLIQEKYSSIFFLGMLSDLSAPEYIFPLTPELLRFALKQKYSRKIFINFLLSLLSSSSLKIFLKVLPCYSVVATNISDSS